MPYAGIHHGKGGIFFFLTLFIFFPLSFLISLSSWAGSGTSLLEVPETEQDFYHCNPSAEGTGNVHSQLRSGESNVDRNTELSWVGTLVTAGLGYSFSAVDKNIYIKYTYAKQPFKVGFMLEHRVLWKRIQR